MGESSGKKRKRDGEGSGKPKKKVTIEGPPKISKITTISRSTFNPPVIATAPGLQIPHDAVFHAYERKDDSIPSSKQRKHGGEKEMILHSTSHRTIDFTAREEHTDGSKPLLNHYLGIYDPKTGELQVIEAKKMVVRGAVREKQASEESMARPDTQKTMMERRAELGQAFGTKKAKKAIESTILNAIAPANKAGEESPKKMDDATRAMLGEVGESTSKITSREDLQAVVDAAKPVPRANLEATEIQDVYDPKAIIGPDILNMVPIREWQEKAQHKESIQVLSRYVAARVNAIAADEDSIMRLRVLRYFYFLLLFYLRTTPGKEKGSRNLPPRAKLKEYLSPAPEAVIENIRRKFADGGIMRKFHGDLLKTHLCAFACIIDNYEVDTQNLKDDLKIDQKAMNQYFHEIGGRVKQVSNKELGRITHVARLTLPLDFPKQRHINPKRRR